MDKFIAARVQASELATRAEWGERCPERFKGCSVCAAWARHDALARRVDRARRVLAEARAAEAEAAQVRG